MLSPRPPVRVRLLFHCASIVAGLAAVVTGHAGEVQLKNGTIIVGKPVNRSQITGVLKRDNQGIADLRMCMIDDDGIVKTFVPERQIVAKNKDVDLPGKNETFNLPQRKQGQNLTLKTKGASLETTPFDQYGRRRVTLRINGEEKPFFQGVTTITPRYLKVAGLNYALEFGLPTSSVPAEILDPMLRQASDQKNPEHRLGIARFYLQAQRFAQAQDELDSIRRDFPNLATKVDAISVELNQLRAQEFLDELKLRRGAGQFELTFEMARKFPQKTIGGAILQEVRELLTEAETQRDRIDLVKQTLGELQAKLPSSRAVEVAPLHAEVCEQLDRTRIDRLDSFLNLATAANLQPEEKIALAYSGWMLGSANAISDLDSVLRVWQARTLSLTYLRTENSNERDVIVSQIKAIEGLSPKLVSQMIPLLPPRIETPELQPGRIGRYDIVPEGDSSAVTYAAMPPLEYHSGRAYPLIVALHAERVSLEQTLEWWGGTPESPGPSQRNGYVVIAPEYGTPDQLEYDYSARSHRAVIDAIRDACHRFHIDADRIYLGGHSMGGDAAFDIGFSHPDLFAGVMPISGASEKYGRYYWQNARQLPFYVIAGDLDRTPETKDARDRILTLMLQNGLDVIFAEYVGRGREHFRSEIAKLFEWMPRHKRIRNPKQIDKIKTLRPTDNEFWWWQFSDIPSQNTCLVWPEDNAKITPLNVSGKINQTADANIINLQCGANSHVLYLSPDLIDFDKRVRVEVRGVQKVKNRFLSPDIGTMLEEFRLKGDRQNLTWHRLSL